MAILPQLKQEISDSFFGNRYVQATQQYGSSIANNFQRMGNTRLGSVVRESFGESVGFWYKSGPVGKRQPLGFAGMGRTGLTEAYEAKLASGIDDPLLGIMSKEGFFGGAKAGLAGNVTGLSKAAAGKSLAKIGAGAALKTAFPLFFTGMSIHTGLTQGGFLSGQGPGLMAVAENLAFDATAQAAFNLVAGASWPLMVGAAAAAGGAYGYYAFGESAQAFKKSLRSVEFGGNNQMLNTLNSAGAVTMRQRAMSAIQNTHINSRQALGNEGFLMHTSYR